MLNNSLFVNKYNAPKDMDPEVEQAFCTALLSPVALCGGKHYHISASISSTGFNFEYASSKEDTRSEEYFDKYPFDRTLSIIYYEVSFKDDPHIPKVERHSVRVKASIFDDEGVDDIALSSAICRMFAANFVKMLNNCFPGKFISSSCHVGEEAVLF